MLVLQAMLLSIVKNPHTYNTACIDKRCVIKECPLMFFEILVKLNISLVINIVS